MNYDSFSIENFKGIQALKFDFQSTHSSMATLVGLNESGKTTILEALSTFYEQINNPDDESSEPLLHTATFEDVHSLVPKGKKHNFNDAIKLSATIALDEDDKESLRSHLVQSGWTPTSIGEKLKVTYSFQFLNSTFQKRQITYGFSLLGRARQQRKDRTLRAHDVKLWLQTMNWLVRRSPPVIYYPNFLLEFPDRIYIEEHEGETPENRFYRIFLQDVLDSMEAGLSLQTHVVKRAKNDSELAEREALESVLTRLASRISGLVFDPEISVFKTDGQRSRSVVVSQPQRGDDKGLHISIRLRDGDDTYFIRERSLGFRWFFAFLLLTQFRISRSTGRLPIFLFDEPASNLHQSAQQRLLKALSQLTAGNDVTVIYTTHSHHLIDPKLLESTFIVRNRGLEDTGLNDDFNAGMTDIEITPYRTFVGTYPDQRSYFQPILDILEYRPSNLEYVPRVVMTEGKTDFYTLSLFQSSLGIGASTRFLPSGGAGGLDTPIQLYIAWGKAFIVLLDADQEGKRQAKRYQRKFESAVQGRILTLEDLNPNWRGYALEDLFSRDDRLAVQRVAYPESKNFAKKRFHHAMQELLATGKEPTISTEAKKNMEHLLIELDKSLDELE